MQQSESPTLPVQDWAVDQVHPYPGNPRQISEQAVRKVAASLQTYGWRQPIVVDEDGVIIVGHTRHKAALYLGMPFVPVHVARGLSPEKVKAYRLADNRTGEEAKWDPTALSVDLQDLKDLGFDLDLTGFDPVELPALPASFLPISGDQVKPLDQRAEVTCPGCGQKFSPAR